MDQKHYLISKLKNLASEIGKVPTEDEFKAYHPMTKDGRVDIKKIFGSYLELLVAAGLTSVDSDIFDLQTHLRQYKGNAT